MSLPCFDLEKNRLTQRTQCCAVCVLAPDGLHSKQTLLLPQMQERVHFSSTSPPKHTSDRNLWQVGWRGTVTFKLVSSSPLRLADPAAHQRREEKVVNEAASSRSARITKASFHLTGAETMKKKSLFVGSLNDINYMDFMGVFLLGPVRLEKHMASIRHWTWDSYLGVSDLN